MTGSALTGNARNKVYAQPDGAVPDADRKERIALHRQSGVPLLTGSIPVLCDFFRRDIVKIETIQVEGFAPAIHAMRNPMDSWSKSDTINGKVGEKDKELSIRLQKAGAEHCKHLRMIMVWADITAPRYWWNEFDTYRNGVEKVSCSTMHRLMAKSLTICDFEKDCYTPSLLAETVNQLNSEMETYKNSEESIIKKKFWRGIIQALPQSYLQKRTVMMSYAALRNIYRQREGHKLKEWQQFREWVDTLPENWMIKE